MAIDFRFTPGRAALPLVQAAAQAAVHDAAEKVLADSQQLVPVETGALKASAKVTDTGPLEASVSYDVVNDEDGYPYGIRQHEDMALHHPNGGQAKFLEQPLHAANADVGEAVAAAIREALR